MATAQQAAELEAWLDQYTVAAAEADAGAVAATWAAYSTVDDWYDPAQTLAAATGAMAAAQAVRATQSGMMAELVSFMVDLFGRSRPRPRPLRVVPDYPRHADSFEVYSRPVFTYRDAVAMGNDLVAAHEAAQERAEVISLTDALLARREAAVTAMEAAGVQRYRRVIRPELSESGTCGLCIAAATRVYTIEELLPIHSKCKCVPMPIIGGVDPGDINASDLELLYETIPATRRKELSKFRYKVLDDGELGPTLEPNQAGRQAPSLGTTQRAEKELSALLPVLDRLEQRAAAGEDVTGPLTYQRDRIAKLRAAAA